VAAEVLCPCGGHSCTATEVICVEFSRMLELSEAL
jgi:hypothetical protein